MTKKQRKGEIRRAKVRYYSCFLLIYPFFSFKKWESYISRKLVSLNKYRQYLFYLVCEKQKILKKIYLSNKNLIVKDKINDLFVSTVYVKIGPKNFCEVNNQIDQISKLALLKKSYEEIQHLLTEGFWTYNDQIKMIAQYYYSMMGLIRHNYRHIPWKNLLIIHKFNDYEITI